MNQIIDDILNTFGSLWHIKTRGNSIEIVTPYATTNNMFVTLFLTQRGEEFIVTDGGALDRGVYECDLPFDEECFEKAFRFYLFENGVSRTRAKGYDYYFKKTPNAVLIPNILFDMANFICAVVSTSFIQFQTEKEKMMVQRFRSDANEFIKALFPKKVRTNTHISDSLSAIKFNAVITNKGQLSLINYVTGSTNAYFISSLAKANLNFDLIDNDPIKYHIRNQITLVDNSVKAYTSAKILPYLTLLEGHKHRHVIPWNERARIETLI